ncbi:MAG: xanthine phosphoribosyltransferase [Clostridia bacterium]|nr:xanthine phosphoribosyltransferase [Clostridia bacterium]
MEALKQRILRDGRAVNEQILIVDSFLNHQVDVELMRLVGEAFAERFAQAKPNRIVTIEASGIAPAVMTAQCLKLPMVILKKSTSRVLSDDIVQTEVFSFTKNAPYQLTLKRQFIENGDRVLLIDDFLANGEAALGACRLIEQAGATVAGIGAVICKAFQPGLQKLRDQGYNVDALAKIRKMSEGTIEFDEA